MGKRAFIFPGQGSQTVGMGKDFYEFSPDAKKIFDQADEYLGYSSLPLPLLFQIVQVVKNEANKLFVCLELANKKLFSNQDRYLV